MLIEVKGYADFDIPYTVCIMESDTEYDIKSLLTEFATKQKLKSYEGKDIEIKNDGVSGLSYKELRGTTEKWILFLKNRGFKATKTKKVIFSD